MKTNRIYRNLGSALIDKTILIIRINKYIDGGFKLKKIGYPWLA